MTAGDLSNCWIAGGHKTAATIAQLNLSSKHVLQRDLYLAHVGARGIDPAKGLGSEA